MAKKDIPINQATAKQLSDYANLMCGLDTVPTIGYDKIRAKMANAGFAPETITVEVADEAPAKKPLSVDDNKRKMFEIMIPHQAGPGGNAAVPVGVNGRTALIQRGIPVAVPAEYVEVLRNAEAVVYDSGPNGELINPRRVSTHPFSILREL